MERTFKIIYTSDTHGHIFPVNYAAGCGESSGLLNLAAQIDKNGNTLVLDGGDSLQGTPLVQYYLAHADEFPHHPVAEAFNAMGCDYFTLGNHDFNFGYDALRAYLCAMDGVCLCANVQDLGGALPLLPETVHTLKNGLRIGITGIVTDYVNVWEQPQNLKKLRITEAFDAARAACARLRPICDICVCIYHGGFEEDLHTGAVLSGSGENLACRIARELDFDLLLTGHQHMPVESVRIGGTFAVQPPPMPGAICRWKPRYGTAVQNFPHACCLWAAYTGNSLTAASCLWSRPHSAGWTNLWGIWSRPSPLRKSCAQRCTAALWRHCSTKSSFHTPVPTSPAPASAMNPQALPRP